MPGNSPSYTLPAADSRGKRLATFLREHNIYEGEDPSSHTVIDLSFGGAKLKALLGNVRKTTIDLRYSSPSCDITVILFAGICDIKSRDRRGEEQEIYYDANPSRIDDIKSTLLDILNFTVENSIHLIIPTILFASLSISKSDLESSRKLRRSRFTVEETI